MQTDTDLETLMAAVAAGQAGLLASIEQLSKIESPSESKAAVNQAVDLVESWGTAMGGRAKRHKNLKNREQAFGDLLELRFAPRRKTRAAKPVLILGHLDTVWALGTLASMPVVRRDGRLYGPGVYDMKAGVAMALAAIRSLRNTEMLDRPVTLLLVSDEEIGSTVSRPKSWPCSRAPSTSWNRHKLPTAPTKLRARESAAIASMSAASPPTVESTLPPATRQCWSWRGRSKSSVDSPISRAASPSIPGSSAAARGRM
jgi:hypothetical protein